MKATAALTAVVRPGGMRPIFTLAVTVYKPPFKVPFWQGTSPQAYYDPPIGSFGLGPDDEAGIYDDPGQVLSVAIIAALFGIFLSVYHTTRVGAYAGPH